MRIAITVGTRPEIIRLYHTIKVLRETYGIDLYLLFTAQNFEVNLTTNIFKDPLLKDVYKTYDWLNIGNNTTFIEQIGPTTTGIYDYLNQIQAHKVLVLGDTNSAMFTAIAAKKLGIPLYHMESGNRCFDINSPEEVNRKIIDSITDVHLCYTNYARHNLLAEGVHSSKIHIIGNPISEFPELHTIDKRHNKILATFHRQENINNISKIVSALNCFTTKYDVLACLHPRYIGEVKNADFSIVPSVNFSDFIKLQKQSKVIITDSGTVCEEAAMLGVPSVIIRNTMERPELLDHGCTILSGADSINKVVNAINIQLNNNNKTTIPKEYEMQYVSNRVKNIIVGKENYDITSRRNM